MEIKNKLYCYVPGCCNTNLNKNISFHFLPRNEIFRKKWIEACNIHELVTKSSRICSNHFNKEEDFHNYEKGRRRKLRKEAVPKYNLPSSMEEACLLKLSSLSRYKYRYRNRRMDSSSSSELKNESVFDFEKQDEAEHSNQPIIIDSEVYNESEKVEQLVNNNSEGYNESEQLDLPISNYPKMHNGLEQLDQVVSKNSEISNGSEHSDQPVRNNFEVYNDLCDGCLLNDNTNDESQLDETVTLAETLLKLKNLYTGLPQSSLKRVVEQCVQTDEGIISGNNKADKSIQVKLYHNPNKRFSILDHVNTEAELYDLAGVHSKTLTALVNCVTLIISENNVLNNSKYSLSVKEMIILTLVKLRHDTTFNLLRLLFGISKQSCINYFKLTLPLLSSCLKLIEYWPEKDEIVNNMPSCFESFRNTRIVLDCTEIAVQKPKCLKCHIRLYSHYYGKTTLKILIGISPCGLIIYHSNAYGGKASDKEIFLQSKILDKLTPGDAIMVDKGFPILNECEERNIRLIRPVFATEKEQFTKEEALLTTKIAAARVHVERVMQRLKTWKCLRTTILWSMAPYIDHIVTIIVGLVNLSSPILADKRFNE